MSQGGNPHRHSNYNFAINRLIVPANPRQRRRRRCCVSPRSSLFIKICNHPANTTNSVTTTPIQITHTRPNTCVNVGWTESEKPKNSGFHPLSLDSRLLRPSVSVCHRREVRTSVFLNQQGLPPEQMRFAISTRMAQWVYLF